MEPIKLVIISDTHNKHEYLFVPPGDILIHAGDFSNWGDTESVERFNFWLGTLPHPHKIVIAGNHDFCFEREPEKAQALLTNGTYLQDESILIEGIRFCGSPWQPWFHNWAFNLQRGEEIRAKWDLIPEDTDVLITHGPPYGFGDQTHRGERVGCEDLLEVVRRIGPRYHIFGHIHEAYGTWTEGNTTFINGSSISSGFGGTDIRKPVVVEYKR